MVGMELVWSDGSTSGRINTFTNSTSITVEESRTVGGSGDLRSYKIHHQGLQVNNDGNVGIGMSTISYPLDIKTANTAADCFIRLDTAGATTSSGILFSMNGAVQWQLRQNQGTDFEAYDNSDNSVGARIQPGGTMWESASDERIKKDIENVGSTLDSINQLRPITYKKKYGKLGGTHVGLLAQEVKPHFPLVVSGEEDNFEELTPTEERPEKYKGDMGIAYAGFVPYLIKAIQELSAEVDKLKNGGDA